jgi:hypothetical protein
MQDLGAFSSFPVQSDYRKEEAAIRRVISSIDQLLPSDRDRKLKQQSSKILNYYTVDLLQQQFAFVMKWLSHSVMEIIWSVTIMIQISVCCNLDQLARFVPGIAWEEHPFGHDSRRPLPGNPSSNPGYCQLDGT